MGDGWFPGAIRDPGKNVNYRRGRTSNQMDVAHFTVGTDSRGLIRDQGLAAFLFPKVGAPFQFCQADSVTAHACEFNAKGCGYELERLNWDEPFTPDQTHWVGEVLRWRNAEYGVPLVHYGGARLPTNTDFRGIANHGSLQHHACDQHSDGWTDAEFAAAIGGATPAPIDTDGDSMVTVYVNPQGTRCYFFVNRNGEFVQKTWNTPVPGQWNTLVIGGSARPAEKVLVDDKLDANLHLFSRSKDGRGMAHATYLDGRWVTQVD